MPNAPVYGTRPYVGLCPTMPQNDAGMRMDPAWSAPMAMSTAWAATNAALPLLDPPVVWPGARGLSTGPVLAVALLVAKHRYSQTDLPAISAPASSMRVTMVASVSGTKPSSTEAPLVSGTPATNTLSLTAMRFPLSLPRGAPLMLVL